MKNKFFTKLIIAVIAVVLAIPTVIISNEQEPTYELVESTQDVTIEKLELDKVGSAGAHEAINQEPQTIYMYSTATVKIRREPMDNEENVVGLIPANAEIIWLENVDDMWSKISINSVEYFICKNYITTIAPSEIISILNIEPNLLHKKFFGVKR